MPHMECQQAEAGTVLRVRKLGFQTISWLVTGSKITLIVVLLLWAVVYSFRVGIWISFLY